MGYFMQKTIIPNITFECKYQDAQTVREGLRDMEDSVRNNYTEEGDVVISIRDMGKEFNPTIEDKSLDLKFDNVYVLNRIASEIKYDRSIGMNLTLIRVGERDRI